MTKAEIASYLVSLHGLLEAQETSGVHNRSQTIGREYEKYWNILKAQILKEQDEDEARERKLEQDGSDKARHDDARDLAGSSEPDRRGGGVQSPAVDHGKGSAGA